MLYTIKSSTQPKVWALVLLMLLGGGLITGCEQGPAEEAGEAIDDAADDAGDAVDDATD